MAARIGLETHGHSAVEVAISLSLFLLVSFGIIDFSRCIYTANIVTAAAQEGARAGLIDRKDIRPTVTRTMNGLDMNRVSIRSDIRDDVVRVTVSYDFEFLTPVVQSIVDTLRFTANASMVSM